MEERYFTPDALIREFEATNEMNIDFLMLSFTQESAVRRLQLGNFYAKEQAKLNAYAASNLAMILLDFYAQAVNMVSQNANSPIRERDLENFLVRTPLMFPIVELPGLGKIQKDMIRDFNENLMINGSFMIEFQVVRGGLNPNNLIRISEIKIDERTGVHRHLATIEFFQEAIRRKIRDKSI